VLYYSTVLSVFITGLDSAHFSISHPILTWRHPATPCGFSTTRRPIDWIRTARKPEIHTRRECHDLFHTHQHAYFLVVLLVSSVYANIKLNHCNLYDSLTVNKLSVNIEKISYMTLSLCYDKNETLLCTNGPNTVHIRRQRYM